MQFQECKWGCVMWLAAHAAKGKTAVADIKTFGLFRRRSWPGFLAINIKNFPAAKKAFAIFFPTETANKEAGRNWPKK